MFHLFLCVAQQPVFMSAVLPAVMSTSSSTSVSTGNSTSSQNSTSEKSTDESSSRRSSDKSTAGGSSDDTEPAAKRGECWSCLAMRNFIHMECGLVLSFVYP